MISEGRLHLAIQKSGRLSDFSRGLLRDAGLRIQNGKNDLTARVENFPIDLMFVRDDDIPTFVSDGVCEFGIVGRNVLDEFALGEAEPRFEVVAALGFGRCALKIAAPERLAYEGPQSLEGTRIATSYPCILQDFLDRNGVSATVVKMNGAVELAPRLGIATFICDLVSTGATLEANGLRPVETVLESEAVLIRTRKTLPEDKADLSTRLLSRIDGVLATQESKYIMLNAPEEALDEIAAILPGAESPTIIPLVGRPGHFAVHAVCQESVFWETLQKLKGAGASAILVLPIEKMMM
ncbi:MAG: ATP phosphoribosyltransferase _ HisGl [uncultured Sphingosinicella sp.]|uniref:ATP phosphoribosyltransferase n=1 Tax=uncultured Sphingosinicella sp. TaxID=478748 RepID=A0A6J4U543_9SPHN|nr:ATP phosphoribosyltransferase [uncultured Sphingosinicella sp.]CAA9538682.1 MAG: ATP phosphoribosyltransferase > HisGl [uncultured Sphingosinicella sp.]